MPREAPPPVSEEEPRGDDVATGATPGTPLEPEAPRAEVQHGQAGEVRPVNEPVHPVEDPPPEPIPGRPLLADGSPCLKSEDCASGICEGLGCTDDTPGTCAPRERACTRDRRPYCGCDGETFFSSGNCPGRRYARKGTCGDPVR